MNKERRRLINKCILKVLVSVICTWLISQGKLKKENPENIRAVKNYAT
jgi:hypothetical protein